MSISAALSSPLRQIMTKVNGVLIFRIISFVCLSDLCHVSTPALLPSHTNTYTHTHQLQHTDAYVQLCSYFFTIFVGAPVRLCSICYDSSKYFMPVSQALMIFPHSFWVANCSASMLFFAGKIYGTSWQLSLSTWKNVWVRY